jgi:putative membrane protein
MAVDLTMASEVLARAENWGPGGWWPIFPLLWFLVIGILVVALFRRGGSRQPNRSAESVLGERFARGEIGEDEYRDRLNVLKGGRK